MAGSAVDATAATPSAATEDTPITFYEAVPKFVEYLASYRSYSPRV